VTGLKVWCGGWGGRLLNETVPESGKIDCKVNRTCLSDGNCPRENTKKRVEAKYNNVGIYLWVRKGQVQKNCDFTALMGEGVLGGGVGKVITQ